MAEIEQERRAYEVHNSVNQTLFSISLIAEAIPRLYEQQPEVGRQGLEALRSLVEGVQAEMKSLNRAKSSSK